MAGPISAPSFAPTCRFWMLSVQPGASGTSYEVQIRLIPEYLQVGPIMGHILVETNDPDVPTLKIPVAGVITDQ